MELTPLRYFVAIASERHMTRAAQRLGVTQPAISAALKRLETEVGAELFHRTAKGVELTGAGRVFLEHAEDVLRRAEESVRAVRQMAGLESGSIAVGGGATATGYLLPAVVGQFRKQHAGIRFSVREAASRTVAEAVLAGSLDLGIVTLPVAVPGVSDLMQIASLEDELMLLVPPGHRLAGRKSFRWADLNGEHFVGFEAGTAVRALVDEASAASGAILDVVMELRSIEAIKQMVRAGIGVGLVSRFALPQGRGQTESPGLRCRDGRIVRSLAVVRRRDRVPSPAAAAFETLLLEHLKQRRTSR